jgi:hypothetical protein
LGYGVTELKDVLWRKVGLLKTTTHWILSTGHSKVSLLYLLEGKPWS